MKKNTSVRHFVLFMCLLALSAGANASPLSVNLKVFLQGSYDASLGRHKDVTCRWASVLNIITEQPFTGSPWNYSGTESVDCGFFVSTSDSTDIVDWVLLELRSASDSITIIARKAAFVREDGLVVGLDGTSLPEFDYSTNGSYFIVVRHRNHLGIMTPTPISLVGGTPPSLYDFTTAQSQAYQKASISTNAAMVNGGSGVYCMWGGNAIADAVVRATGAPSDNDYLKLINGVLGGNTSVIVKWVYNTSDFNLDGVVRATGAPADNDELFLKNSVLGGNLANMINQHLL